jgi:replicative DNA helicase
MGKEELMLSMILDIILESKLSVLLFSTNHQKADYVQRLLAIHCDILVMHLFQGSLEPHEWDRLDKRTGELVDAPLFMHDSLDLPLNELVETARNCIREKEVKIILIDCLQMVDFTNEDDNPSDRVAKVMLSLKQLARLCNIPIIVGSMLSRGIEYREGLEGKQPQLMDLMNSSFIEGLADVIMMVHRPEYYHIYQDDNGRNLRGLIEIIVRKNALKPLGSIFLDYHEKTGVVCVRKNGKSTSKPVSLKDFSPFNEPVKKLIKEFDLEEELPF